jgi:hypothetical protein
LLYKYRENIYDCVGKPELNRPILNFRSKFRVATTGEVTHINVNERIYFNLHLIMRKRKLVSPSYDY